MSESDMRAKVIVALRSLDAVAVENPAYPGTPDVNYVEGWIELKWLRKWPVNGGIVKIEHFSPQQKVWLVKRWSKGGNVFLLLQCKREWLLFDGLTAAQIVGNATREELFKRAVWSSTKGLQNKGIIECLRRK